jgi:hypothetical protein
VAVGLVAVGVARGDGVPFSGEELPQAIANVMMAPIAAMKRKEGSGHGEPRSAPLCFVNELIILSCPI